jgi:mannitol/fructose-specific phosphotransferase system IIA component (Ntr-type)
MLVDFAAVNLAVIVMRESRTDSYDSGFRSPLYPWTQLSGVLVSLVLIPLMGWLSAVVALSLIAGGLIWYVAYARGRAEHAVALRRVLESIAAQILSREQAGPALDRELRKEMKRKHLRPGDPFAEVVAGAHVVDLPADAEWDDLMRAAVEHFVRSYPERREEIHQGLYEASRMGNTPAVQGIALPHVLLEGIEHYELLMARSRSSLHFPGVASGVKAVFVLLGTKENPQQHLRMLAAVARRVEEPDFLARWMKAKDGEHLKRVLIGLPGR